MKTKLFLLAAATLFVSCEKVDLDNEDSGSEEVKNGHTLTVNIFNVGQADFVTRATLKDVATRVSFALYDESGTRVAYANQTTSDSDFGQFNTTISDGTYRIVCIAHSGAGVATTSALDKITFYNNKVTDTFFATQTFTISDNATISLTPQRCVAMIRLCSTTVAPETFTQMKLYYTGGSSTLSGVTGYGCVNSRQTEYRSTLNNTKTFEIYTFPQGETGTIKLVATAENDAETVTKAVTIDEIPVEVGKITTLTGDFFSGAASGKSGGVSFSVTDINDQWEDCATLNY